MLPNEYIGVICNTIAIMKICQDIVQACQYIV